jgi:cob(I)alamin adenosyltransferase
VVGACRNTVDETNAVIGTARAAGVTAELDAVLARIQAELFTIGAELACVPGKETKLGLRLIDAAEIEALEHDIDRAEATLSPLKNFVLPAGSAAAAALHHARTVCRRAERRLVCLSCDEPVRSELIVYLNRLSDLAFVLARVANHDAGLPDELWNAR